MLSTAHGWVAQEIRGHRCARAVDGACGGGRGRGRHLEEAERGELAEEGGGGGLGALVVVAEAEAGEEGELREGVAEGVEVRGEGRVGLERERGEGLEERQERRERRRVLALDKRLVQPQVLQRGQGGEEGAAVVQAEGGEVQQREGGEGGEERGGAEGDLRGGGEDEVA